MSPYHYHARKKNGIFLLPQYTIFFLKLNKNWGHFFHGSIQQGWNSMSLFYKILKNDQFYIRYIFKS
jgi:hypothetical protein